MEEIAFDIVALLAFFIEMVVFKARKFLFKELPTLFL